MNCPRCGSRNLWDDNLWWGCTDCGYAESEDGPTFVFAKQKPGLATSVDEMHQRGQVTARSIDRIKCVETGRSLAQDIEEGRI